jgi:hypothetical protein
VLAIGFAGVSARIFDTTLSQDASAPTPAPPAAQASLNGALAPGGRLCDPNYSPCIPLYPPDLECEDLGHPVSILGGSDPHHLDDDGDRLGCELVADPPPTAGSRPRGSW